MPKIETFVFFDLETTGLPQQEGNRTKITELSMVVAKRNHILECEPGDTPRIMNKLSLCLNPTRMIQTESTGITGLSNDLLEHESCFNKTVADTICNFLSIYTKPICLVAHYGNRFDYPIFKAEFSCQNYDLPEYLLCTDSYQGFKDIIGQLEKDSNHPEAATSSKVNQTVKESYKLKDIYERLLGKKPEECHRAEADCLLLLESVIVVRKEFVEWADCHCQNLMNIPTMQA